MIQTVTINPSLDRYYDIHQVDINALNRVLEKSDFPGGKGINIARVLNELGTTSTVYGFVGGQNGDMLVEACSELNTHFIRIAKNTRVNHKFRDLTNHTITEFNEFGPDVTDKEFMILQHCLSRDILANDWCVLGGSAPKGLEDDVYVKLMAIIRHRHGKVMVSCDMPWIKPALESLPDVVKVNLQELERLAQVKFEDIKEIKRYCLEWITRGVGLFIVSLGSDGALFVSEEKTIYCESLEVTVVNTVGAGDAMLAGIVKCLQEESSIEELASFSIACATAAVARDEIAVGSLDTVQDYQKQVIIREL